MIGKLSLPLRLSALVGALAAVSIAAASPQGLITASTMLDKDPSVAKSRTQQSKDTSAPISPKQQAAFKQRLRDTSKAFLENGGQWDDTALYVGQSPNLNLWVTKKGLRSEYFANYAVGDKKLRKGQVVDMSFVGGQALKSEGVRQLPTITQFIEPGPANDVKTVHSYEEVKLSSIYKGVDMRVYNDGSRPRYDLIVEPGANASSIKMKFQGADSVKIDAKGNLALGTRLGTFEQRGLMAYQQVNGKKAVVPVQFTKVSKDTIGFKVGSYDHSKPLVIDPIVYGSYYGGDAGVDEVRAVTSDADAGIYFTGMTQAPDFPVLFGPFSINKSGASDAFIAKLRGDAYVHEYSAYIGGSGRETGKFISIDPTGNNVWVAGVTSSTNFPTLGGPMQGARAGASDIFLVKFTKSTLTVLNPVYSTYYGGTAGTEALTGFAVAPVSGDLVLAGHSNATMPNVTGFPGTASASWILRLNPAGQSVVWGKFLQGASPMISGCSPLLADDLNNGQTGEADDTTSQVTGSSVAVDANDNVLTTGTVFAMSNQDTATAGSPGFVTTAGVFPTGRLLRFADVYIEKFDPAGNVVYGALLGGAGNDAGSSIAVDETGNAYLTGLARSSDFPRTPGTFGQVFSAQSVVFVSKVSTDGSQLVYSTNLKTAGNVYPTGIAVNQRGFAFITGVASHTITFPDPPGMPADPNVPTGSTGGVVQVTPDNLRATNNFPAINDLPATDGWLNIIDSTAETLLFGTLIGGVLNEVAFAPYVDRVGDVWVSGYSESGRFYTRFPVGMGSPRAFDVRNAAGLDPGFITPGAFKEVIESPFSPGAGTYDGVPYGSRYSPFTSIQTIDGVSSVRDGYLFRFRLDVPLVKTLALNPSSIAGGLGQQSVGTVTISGPAPAEGVDVNVTLDNSVAASFDATSSVSQITVTIPSGATTGTFTMFSSPVIDPTQVQIKADYLGSFKIQQLTVNPWLSQLTLTPTTVVSGNTSTGRVTLFTTATEDVTVAISTDNPALISFPNGPTVTVPAGQQSVNFPIQVSTVDTQQSGNISATFLGKTRNQTLIVKPSVLASLSLNPNRIAGGSTSVGTVTLDGTAPSTGATVNISITQNPGNINTFPATVTIPAGQRSATFNVTANLVASNTFSTFRASFNSVNKDATLLIDNISLSSFVINPTSIQGGGSVNGTVTINQPAPPGGAFVTLTSPNPEVLLPDEDSATPGFQIMVGANATSRTFSIGTVVTVTTVNATISASRGGVPITKPLTILPVDFTISITPSSILGGQGATLKITLTGPAPVSGVTVAITKTSLGSNPPDATGAVTINGGNPVTVTSGNTTQSFPITTTAVTATDTVQITGQVATNIHSANLEVRAPRVTGITFAPSTVRGLLTTTMTVTLDGPAPPGGAMVALSASPNSQIVNLPASVTVPAGATFVSQLISTNKVSRTLGTNIKGTYGGLSVIGVLMVTR